MSHFASRTSTIINSNLFLHCICLARKTREKSRRTTICKYSVFAFTFRCSKHVRDLSVMFSKKVLRKLFSRKLYRT